MNGIIYCRVSSKEQIEGTSLESQESACREYARSHNLTIRRTFIERGESAKFADRTQLVDLLDFCRSEKGKIQVLLVWKVDRFARNVGDHFNIKATLLKYGVRVVSVTEPIDANPEGRLLETILAGFAQFDNDVRALRTVQGMRRKLQEGIFPWMPPLGYKLPSRDSKKKTEPDVPDQPLFALCERAWKEFAKGTYTKAEMLRLMANWGILTRNGKPLSAQSLDNFFSNKFYAGILTDPWSGEEYEGKHLPMVTREEFARVQEIIQRRNRSLPHQKARREFPLRGLVRCQSCHAYMTASFSRGRSANYPYYHCVSKKSCVRRSHRAESVHREFFQYLSTVAPSSDILADLRHAIVEVGKERNDALRQRKVQRATAIQRVEKELQELIRMRATKLITDEEFLRQKARIADRQTALSAATMERFRAEELEKRLDEIIQPLSDLGATWQALPQALQVRFQRLVLPAGFVREEIRTAELGLLFQVFGEFRDGNSNGVPLVRKFWNRIIQEIRGFSDILRSFREQQAAA